MVLAARSALLASMFALLFAPSAGAVTTAAIRNFPRTGNVASHLVLVVRADGPQRSDISVAPALPGPGATVAFTVIERGGPLEPGDSCVALDAQSARCEATPLPDLPFDEVSVAVPLSGGRADLRALSDPRLSSSLVGGPEADVLLGMSTGRNSIMAMPPNAPEGAGDVMEGGSGRDTIVSGPGPDRIDGKGERDRVQYFGRELGIRVNLARGTAGDGDTLSALERVEGSSFRDILIGDSVRNVLVGLSGNDSLEGRGGDDSLVAGPGRRGRSGYDDELLGGDGHDRIDGGRGPDRILGGRGNDLLIGGPGHDLVNGGPGGDRFFAGGSNDLVLSRDGLGEAVDCQDGRGDFVRADRNDRLRSCERGP
ncbi:MAG TPA: hypothetical protein VES62_17785 [Thermoleophilaceae bacterium]|jgi:hypothetical protein|nr:hypothetical protein [Actinomycetota bacterium]HYN52774.1 hypothetical protein [Thermoleophilaceae bacterium]